MYLKTIKQFKRYAYEGFFLQVKGIKIYNFFANQHDLSNIKTIYKKSTVQQSLSNCTPLGRLKQRAFSQSVLLANTWHRAKMQFGLSFKACIQAERVFIWRAIRQRLLYYDWSSSMATTAVRKDLNYIILSIYTQMIR